MESTFIDYFIIYGLDISTGLELEQYASKVQGGAYVSPLERSYVAKLLGHYPELREGQPFAEEILALCLPKGLRFSTQKNVPAEPSFHTFACIRADGTRSDGCVLTFWEEVVHAHIIQAMQSLHSLHLRELTGSDNGGGPASGALNSGNDEYSGSRMRLDDSSVSGRGGSHTLPRRGRSHRSKRTSFYDASKDKLFVCKCLAMTTRLPMVGACESVLRTLYSFVQNSTPPPLPLESYVYWLLFEVPLPPPGRSLKLTLAHNDIVCQRPGVNELPFFDYSLRHVFDLLPVEIFLKVYTCVLLEQQILLCSKVLQRLMLVAETLTSLLFPFRWQHVYVPILPYSQAMFLEAPLPFIMGLWYEDAIPDEILQSNICLVDIDTRHVELPEDVPALPDRQELMQELFYVFEQYSERENSAYDQCMQHSMAGSKGRRNDYQWKRMSRSFDEDSLAANMEAANNPSSMENNNSTMNNSRIVTNGPPHRSQLPPLPLDVLKESAPLARITALARKAGVNVPLENLQQELESLNAYRNSPSCRRYFEDMRFNNAVREIFVNRFVYMLFSYDHFIIGNYNDKETFDSNRESMQNFDKASFLSDQPESHLPFLSAFIETQMFASFIDNKILAQWETPDPFLELFDQRLIELRERYGDAMVRTPTYEVCPSVAMTEEMIAKREESFDYEVPRPHTLDPLIDSPDSGVVSTGGNGGFSNRVHEPGFFPLLDANVLNRPPLASPQRSPWKQRYRHLRQKEQSANDRYAANQVGGLAKHFRNSANLTGLANDLTPSQVAQTNWRFVEQLLREAKAKTKRMLVEKMGKEAVELGHADLSITGVEENTLVASLCDLIERIWSHGLHKKKGKSALWTHLLALQELEKVSDEGKAVPPAYLTPDSSKPPHPLVVYFQNLQKDMGTNAGGNAAVGSNPVTSGGVAFDSNNAGSGGGGGQWSTNLLKAASFICDKLQQQTAAFTGSTPELNMCEQMDSIPSRSWKKRSFRDFSPWSSNMTSASSNGSLYSSNTPTPTAPAPSFAQYDSYNAASNATNTTNPPPYGAGQYEPLSPRKRSLSRPRSPELGQSLKPLPNCIAYDMRNVLKMTEIKTDIGFARAFVRLALERKMLHKHLKTLLSNYELLRSMYKRYAFLRCEDEKEQFLFHILSLHAADFHCFTNTFTKTKMTYQVLIVPGGGRFTIGATVQPNIWIRVAGTCGQSGTISVPKNTLQFTFEQKNLGVLSTLRIGHETTVGIPQPSKWFMEYALIRNEITGRAYKFPCGRWFGRGVDDGSLERLLVAEPISMFSGTPDSSSSKAGWRTPPRSRSPSAHRKGSVERMTPRSRVSDLEQQLGEAVNNIVKSFYRCDRDKSNLTALLCGDRGLVWCMEQAFLVGFRSSRLFRHFYPWDFVEKFALFCATCLRDNVEGESRENKAVMAYCCRLVARINTNTNVGKDGKFQVFVLISLRDHQLPALIVLMSNSPVTQNMYEEPSFLKTPRYRVFLTQLLASLNEFTFDLEKSLTWGIET